LSQKPARAPTTLPARNGQALRRAVHRPALALAFYLPGVLIALLASLPLQRDLERDAQGGPWVDQLASRNWPAALLELLGLRATSLALDEPPSTEMAQLLLTVVTSLSTVGLGLLIHGLLYSYLAGGLLAALRGEPGHFWTHCRRWFWPMARLGLLDLTILTAVTVVGLVLLAALNFTPPGTLPIAAAALAVLLLLLNGILEVARAALVGRPDRRAVGALRQTLGLFVSPRALGAALLLWLLLALLSSVLVAASIALQLANLPIPLTIIAAQGLAFANAWLKVSRLAVAVQLDQAISGASAFPPAQLSA
jgi:hypothetical protein